MKTPEDILETKDENQNYELKWIKLASSLPKLNKSFNAIICLDSDITFFQWHTVHKQGVIKKLVSIWNLIQDE